MYEEPLNIVRDSQMYGDEGPGTPKIKFQGKTLKTVKQILLLDSLTWKYIKSLNLDTGGSSTSTIF